eukprot:COSAG02_NODE_14779_length_1237_cov_1.172232_1_plen_311_part_10
MGNRCSTCGVDSGSSSHQGGGENTGGAKQSKVTVAGGGEGHPPPVARTRADGRADTGPESEMDPASKPPEGITPQAECPQGHLLLPFELPDETYGCDICREMLQGSSVTQACLPCSFHVCAHCVSAGFAQSRVRQMYAKSQECGSIDAQLFASSIADSERHCAHTVNGRCLHPHVRSDALDRCNTCGTVLGDTRLRNEERQADQQRREDLMRPQSSGVLLHSRGVSIEFVVAFTEAHNCWEWPTWRVVRDIIKPATARTRCYYTELPGVGQFVSPAKIFISHCWGAPWKDTVMACVHGACTGRVVWLDVFA